MLNKEELKILKIKLEKLEKKDIDLIISDFDDTIFCRNEQLQNSELLRNNRGNAGNEIILNEIGLEKYGNKYYKDKKTPESIVSKLRKGHDVIITAGNKKLQNCKLTHTGLNEHNYIVVNTPDKKIIESIKYIINELKFIPNKVTIYEDRPKYFIEYKDFLEDFLGTTIEIMFVEMKDNFNEPKITKIS